MPGVLGGLGCLKLQFGHGGHGGHGACFEVITSLERGRNLESRNSQTLSDFAPVQEDVTWGAVQRSDHTVNICETKSFKRNWLAYTYDQIHTHTLIAQKCKDNWWQECILKTVICHPRSHAVPDTGAQWDKKGEPKPDEKWWNLMKCCIPTRCPTDVQHCQIQRLSADMPCRIQFSHVYV